MTEIYISDIGVSARYGVHRVTPWRWVKTDPTFPRPVCLSPGCTRWKLSDLVNWETEKASRTSTSKSGGAE